MLFSSSLTSDEEEPLVKKPALSASQCTNLAPCSLSVCAVCVSMFLCLPFHKVTIMCVSIGNPLEEWPCMWQNGLHDSSVEAAINDLTGRQLGCAVCAVYSGCHPILNLTPDAVSAVQKEHLVASKGLRRSPRKKGGQDALAGDMLVCKECYVTVHPGEPSPVTVSCVMSILLWQRLQECYPACHSLIHSVLWTQVSIIRLEV